MMEAVNTDVCQYEYALDVEVDKTARLLPLGLDYWVPGQ